MARLAGIGAAWLLAAYPWAVLGLGVAPVWQGWLALLGVASLYLAVCPVRDRRIAAASLALILGLSGLHVLRIAEDIVRGHLHQDYFLLSTELYQAVRSPTEPPPNIWFLRPPRTYLQTYLDPLVSSARLPCARPFWARLSGVAGHRSMRPPVVVPDAPTSVRARTSIVHRLTPL
jgi:hypothetical protein